MQPDQHSKWLKDEIRLVEEVAEAASTPAFRALKTERLFALREALQHYEESDPCLSVGEVRERVEAAFAVLNDPTVSPKRARISAKLKLRIALAEIDKAFPPEEEGDGVGAGVGAEEPQSPGRASVDSATTSTQQCNCDYDGVYLCHSLPVERCKLGGVPRLIDALRYIAGADVGGMEPHMRPKEVAERALSSIDKTNAIRTSRPVPDARCMNCEARLGAPHRLGCVSAGDYPKVLHDHLPDCKDLSGKDQRPKFEPTPDWFLSDKDWHGWSKKALRRAATEMRELLRANWPLPSSPSSSQSTKGDS